FPKMETFSFPTRRSSDLSNPQHDWHHAGHRPGSRPDAGRPRPDVLQLATVFFLMVGFGLVSCIVVGLLMKETTIPDRALIRPSRDRKSTRLNSSHAKNSY